MRLLVFFILISTGIYSQKKATPIMEFETEVINYGKINQQSSGKKTFKFTNVGNAPLIIQKVKGSCGCVVMDFPKKPIMPNETGEIKITYNVLKLGRISRTVTVFSNATKPIKTLKIKGKVIKEKTKID
jgi:hypothetical protein